MPRDRQQEKVWFNVVVNGTVPLIERELGHNRDLLNATNPSEARMSSELPADLTTVVGGSTQGMNALSTALITLADHDVVAYLAGVMTPAQINAQWANGNTALHLAAVIHNAEAVRLLLAHGADPTIQNKFGVLPAEMVHGDPETEDAFTPMEAEHLSDIAGSAAGTAGPAPIVPAESEYQPLYNAMVTILSNSPVFGRESFGGDKILDVVRSVDPTAGAVTPTSRVQRKVAVVRYDEAGTISPGGTVSVDPYSDRKKYTTGPVTLDTATASGGSNAVRKVRGQDFRKSLGRMSEQLQVSGQTNIATTEFKNKLIVRIVDIKGLQIKGIKDNTQMLIRMSLGNQVRYSLVFAIGPTLITFNDESSFIIDDLTAPIELHVELYRRKTSWTDKAFSPFKKAKTSADESRDERVGNLCPRPLADLVSKANNRMHCDDFVWFPSTPRSVLGISSMEFYLHTNRAATSVPNTLADCARLVQERNDALAKVWTEGIVTISNNMLDWRPRYGRLQHGELHLFDDYYHNELRDVKSLTGLSAITLMNKEECDVPHSFKVTTDSTFWYMFTSSRAEQEQWIAAMLKMMVALEGPRASAPASLPAPVAAAAPTPAPAPASIPTPTTPLAAAPRSPGLRSPGLRSPAAGAAAAATGAENIAPASGSASASASKTISAIPPRHRARLN